MSAINNINSVAGLGRVQINPVQRQVPAEPPAQIPLTDRLELSGVKHLLDNLKANDVRTEKVSAIKNQIESGTYEDDAKLDVAIDRLLDDLSD